MKEYTRPSIQAVEFETTDVIQTSGILTDGGSVGDFTGGGAQGGWGANTTSEENLYS